jgi:hypothetical protein
MPATLRYCLGKYCSGALVGVAVGTGVLGFDVWPFDGVAVFGAGVGVETMRRRAPKGVGEGKGAGAGRVSTAGAGAPAAAGVAAKGVVLGNGVGVGGPPNGVGVIIGA